MIPLFHAWRSEPYEEDETGNAVRSWCKNCDKILIWAHLDLSEFFEECPIRVMEDVMNS